MAIVTNLTQRLGIEHPYPIGPVGFVAAGPGRRRERRGRLRHDWGWGRSRLAGAEFTALARAVSAVASSPGRSRSARCPGRGSPASASGVMLSFGDAAPFLPKIKRARLLAVSGPELAHRPAVLRDGADIIVEGTEAGGHGGGRSTLPLVPTVVDLGRVQAAACPWWRRRHHRWTRAGGGAHARCGWRGDGHALLRGVRIPRLTWARRRRGERRRDATELSTTSRRAIRGRRVYAGRPSGIASPRRGMGARCWRGTRQRTRYAEAAAQGDADIAVVFAGEGMDLFAVEPAAAILARVIREAEAARLAPPAISLNRATDVVVMTRWRRALRFERKKCADVF